MALSFTHLVCICITVLLVNTVHCDTLFTALIDLEKLLHTENTISYDIRGYIQQERERLNQLSLIADDYESHSKAAFRTGTDIHVGNPINAFLLVKRFTMDWYKVEDLIRQNSADQLLNNIQSHSLPEYGDFTGSAQALLRLQDTYALPTEQLAKGEIKGAPDSGSLSADDCYHLGQIAYNAADYYHTILWMTQALDMMKKLDYEHPEICNAYDYLAYSSYMKGNIDIALRLTQEWLKIDPYHERARANEGHYKELLAERGLNFDYSGTGEVHSPKEFNFKNERDNIREQEYQNYESLCRGENIMPIRDAHKLYCEYSKPHGYYYFQLRPLKLEVVSFYPKISFFHGAMTDNEVDRIQEISAPRLATSTVFNPKTGVIEPAYYRVSKTTWLDDDDDPVIARISHRV